MRRHHFRIAHYSLAILLLCGVIHAQAQDSPTAPSDSDTSAVRNAEDALKKKGLRRQGNSLALMEESDLSKLLSSEKRAKRELLKATNDFNQMLAIERQAQGLLNQYRQQRRQLNAELPNARGVTRHNRIVSMMNELTDRIAQMQENKQLDEQVAAARKAYNESREQYIELLLAARKLADKLQHNWADLAQDTEALALDERLNQASGKTFEIVESKNLQSMLKTIQKLEETVLSESIELRNDAGTFVVDVTVNSEHRKAMCVDSGSSLVALPFAAAKEMGLEPDETAETIILILADGRQVPAKRISIASLRVGKFTVEDVDGAVLPVELTEAPLILGMSFLGNFKFDIDPSEKKLTITRLEGDDIAPPKASDKPAAKPK